jgi:hypothetical protein
MNATKTIKSFTTLSIAAFALGAVVFSAPMAQAKGPAPVKIAQAEKTPETKEVKKADKETKKAEKASKKEAKKTEKKAEKSEKKVEKETKATTK